MKARSRMKRKLSCRPKIGRPPNHAKTALIADLICEGKSNKEIETFTGLSRRGVCYHINKIYKELKLYSYADQRLFVISLLRKKGLLREHKTEEMGSANPVAVRLEDVSSNNQVHGRRRSDDAAAPAC